MDKTLSVPTVTDNRWIATAKAAFWPVDVLEEYSKQFGDKFQTSVFGMQPVIILSHPDDIRAILTEGQFNTGETQEILKPIFGDFSSLLLDRETHQKHRKLILPSFNNSVLNRYGQTICDITQTKIQNWQIKQPILMGQEMREISLQILLPLILGSESQNEEFTILVHQWLNTFQSPLTLTSFFFPLFRETLGKGIWQIFLKLKEPIDNLIYSVIANRRKQLKQDNTQKIEPDILSLLITAQNENEEKLNDQELHDELITLLFAGYETIASALTWLFYWVHHDSAIRDKLVKELQAVFAPNDPSALTKLPYLNAVCQESLRIYPVNLMTEVRIAKEPFKLGNHHFSEGTCFQPSIYLLHHREELYPHSKEFKPERFLEHRFSPYEYMPFGGGNRRCLGMNLALYKMKLILATVLMNWQLNAPHNQRLNPVRRGLAISPPTSFQLTPIKKILT